MAASAQSSTRPVTRSRAQGSHPGVRATKVDRCANLHRPSRKTRKKPQEKTALRNRRRRTGTCSSVADICPLSFCVEADKAGKKTRGSVMITTRAKIRALGTAFLAAFLVLGLSSASQAGPLGVDVEPIPSIIAGFMTSSYDATTGAFAANGWALTLNTGTGKTSITTPFRLLASIENSGVATNGSLTVGSITAPLLFSANLLGFGFNAVSGGSLEFLFGSPSGSYVPGVYSATKPLDVMITGLGAAFPGTFSTSWFASSSAAEIREDPPPVDSPEPSTLLLMLVGASGLYWRRRATAA